MAIYKWFTSTETNKPMIQPQPPQQEEQPKNLTEQEKIFAIAKAEAGIAEKPGPLANRRIIEYHQSTTLKASSDEVPWCSSFVNWCVLKAGYKPTGSAAARSWLEWGIPVSEDDVRVGDIAIFQRGLDGASGHVTFVNKVPNKFSEAIECFGGNQNNCVSVKKYPRLLLLGYRRVA